MSGIFDNFQASLNRGVNAVGRSTQTAQLNMQLKDLLKQRQNLAAQLGASLYEITKDNAEFRVGREAIYDGIAAVDAQRAQIEASIAEIKAAQAAETASAPEELTIEEFTTVIIETNAWSISKGM